MVKISKASLKPKTMLRPAICKPKPVTDFRSKLLYKRKRQISMEIDIVTNGSAVEFSDFLGLDP